MNFLTRVVVVALLASNVGLAGLWWRERSRATRGMSEDAVAISANAAVNEQKAGAKREPEEKAGPAGEDPRVLRDVLRAAGVDEELIRQFVTSAVWRKHQQEDAEKRQREWWRHSPHSSRLTRVPAATMKAVGAELRELLGDVATEERMRSPQLASLPVEKRAAVARVLSDYDEMTGAIYAEMGDFQMPEDRKRVELLKAERERDLRALLTPEEYEQALFLELPEVQRSQLIAEQLGLSEAEFHAVVKMRREFNAKLGPEPRHEQVTEVERAFEEALAGLVGRERIEEQKLKQSQDYLVLAKARERLGFSDDVVAGVLAQRSQTLMKAAEIQSGAMTVAEKRAALKALAVEAKAGVGEHLGEAAAEGYFMQNGMGWLRELERGRGVRVTTGGWVESVEVK